ncbi:MAG: NADH dehydrogenase (quinone) subunit D [Pseudobdellovibrionaceae bacterium]|nr:NADH dehydrogenase (quinone) subunit D [Bdellovibrionales bacterium]USN46321.1 MAG: NADH dehydrogenase (quinone) subunit D [Pseudobdellovibrionaceae bacterium]
MRRLEELRQHVSAKFSNNNFNFIDSFGDNVIEISPKDVVPVLSHLKENCDFDILMQIAGADYPEREKRFDVVYELFSSKDFGRVRVKTSVSEDESVPTAIPVWRAANWFERETWDMYGIKFDGHPNLRRFLLHHQFVGYPLRKDYDADQQQHCTTAMPIHFEDEYDYQPDPEKDLLPLNIGPSHPATHGTLRVMAELDGEKVNRANVELGFLHRCFEKMAETHPYNQVIPYTDRLNYCSAPMNNVGYCKAVERLLGVEIPPRAQAIRIMLCELSRIIDHIVCIGANAVDLGALTGFFWLFGYREKVYALFEKLCGARLTVALTRVGGMAQDPPEGWFDDVLKFCDEMSLGIDEIERLLSGNKIWIQRTQGVGAISAEDAMAWGYTGPCLRAAGVSLDLRKADPYYGYETLDFDIPVGTSGDVYDRYLVRVAEMRESIKIIRQVAKNVPGGDYTIRDKGIVLPEKKDVYGNIEGLMNHFMLVIKGLRPPAGEIYDATEAANGELGFYLVSDGSGNPYRLKVRPPCFAIYQSFSEQVTGGLVADVIAILGSMNLIAGELDR